MYSWARVSALARRAQSSRPASTTSALRLWERHCLPSMKTCWLDPIYSSVLDCLPPSGPNFSTSSSRIVSGPGSTSAGDPISRRGRHSSHRARHSRRRHPYCHSQYPTCRQNGVEISSSFCRDTRTVSQGESQMSALTLRLPNENHARLKSLARRRGTSVNRLMEEMATVMITEADAEARFAIRAVRGRASLLVAWRCYGKRPRQNDCDHCPAECLVCSTRNRALLRAWAAPRRPRSMAPPAQPPRRRINWCRHDWMKRSFALRKQVSSVHRGSLPLGSWGSRLFFSRGHHDVL